MSSNLYYKKSGKVKTLLYTGIRDFYCICSRCGFEFVETMSCRLVHISAEFMMQIEIMQLSKDQLELTFSTSYHTLHVACTFASYQGSWSILVTPSAYSCP